MRQRKRAYDKAKKLNNHQQWQKYKRLRHETTNMLRSSKREYFEKMANKLNTNVTVVEAGGNFKNFYHNYKKFKYSSDEKQL